jgi:hypothetical protein
MISGLSVSEIRAENAPSGKGELEIQGDGILMLCDSAYAGQCHQQFIWYRSCIEHQIGNASRSCRAICECWWRSITVSSWSTFVLPDRSQNPSVISISFVYAEYVRDLTCYDDKHSLSASEPLNQPTISDFEDIQD